MKPLAVFAALALSGSSLFASADLVTTAFPVTNIRAGFASVLYFNVRNAGPDTASAVKLTVSSDIPINCVCDLGDIPARQTRSGSVAFTAPDTAGTFTIAATASSTTSDPNPADNTVSVTYTVSADPDVSLSIGVPALQDLALPFTMSIYLGNNSKSTAHDLEVTVDFRTDVIPKTLPDGCSSPFAGRVVCRLDSLKPTVNGPLGPAFVITLVAPTSWNDGLLQFKGVVIEREHDFDPISNATSVTATLYRTFYVTSTANEGGPGTLREAITNANSACFGNYPCAIAFRIDEASPNGWKTIRITKPLPMVTAQRLRIDGGTQTAFFGDTNPDGPEIEISGGGATDGDGLLVANCGVEIANLTVNGFLRNGISVTDSSQRCIVAAGANLHHLFIGTDAAGSSAIPNARGIGTSVTNGSDFGTTSYATLISDCVISGNLHSGIFGLSGRLNVAANRIGVKAHSDDPLPNGNAGVFVGLGGYGSDVGASYFDMQIPSANNRGNVIAFNGQMGVAVASGVSDVGIRNNRIWANALLGIDIGLDGPTLSSGGVTTPSITLAHYDPATGKTVIEGDFTSVSPSAFNVAIDLFANDAPDPTGLGEGQRPLGHVTIQGSLPSHFRFTADGDLTGQFISATMTRVRYIGFAKPVPEGIDQGFLTQTSEFSATIEVR